MASCTRPLLSLLGAAVELVRAVAQFDDVGAQSAGERLGDEHPQLAVRIAELVLQLGGVVAQADQTLVGGGVETAEPQQPLRAGQELPGVAHRGIGAVAQHADRLVDDGRGLGLVDVERRDPVGGRAHRTRQPLRGHADLVGIQTKSADPIQHRQQRIGSGIDRAWTAAGCPRPTARTRRAR